MPPAIAKLMMHECGRNIRHEEIFIRFANDYLQFKSPSPEKRGTA